MVPIFEKGVKIEAANPDESPEFRTVICGRIYIDLANAKWISEAYNAALIGKKEDVNNKISSLGDLNKREDMPSIDIAQWEEEYTQQKIQASKGRRGRKDDKSGKSQSKTDEKKSKAKKEEEEEPKPEEVEETLEDKLVGYMNFPVGPINIDCEKDVETIESEIVEEFKNANPVLFEKCANGVEVFVKDKQ